MSDLVNNPLLTRLAVAAVIVVVAFLMTGTVRRLLSWLGHRVFARTETALDDRILTVVLRNVRPLLLVVGFGVALREIRKAVTPEDLTLTQILEYCEILLYILVVGLAVRVILGVIREIIVWYLDKASTDVASNLTRTLGPLTNKAVSLLVGFVALIIVLDHLGINIGSLLVSLGVGSLAVALAAQDTIANMIAGFLILVDRPFRVGDRIEISTGQVGDVREIGLRSTRLVNFDNNLIVIPNADLVKSRIVNFSFPVEPMRVVLRFTVAYGSDVEKVRGILLEAAAGQQELLKDPAPQVFLTEVGDTAIQLTLSARASSYEKVWAAETSMREKIYRAFLDQGIRVPVQRRLVQMQATA
jgi:small-conductance mechanosensitive channel